MIVASKARLFSPRSLAFGVPGARCHNGPDPLSIRLAAPGGAVRNTLGG